jgi:hypothetical protein
MSKKLLTLIAVVFGILPAVALVLCARGALAQGEEGSTSCTLSAPGMKPVSV